MVVLLSEGAIIGLAVVGVVVLLAIIFACWWISTSNWFKRAKVKVDEANSGIDVALTKRYDLLTKLLASVKGYAKHEYETLSQVIAMRSGNNIKDLSLKERFELTT